MQTRPEDPASRERTLADLRDTFHAVPRFDPSASLRRVEEAFDKEPALRGVLIEEGGQLLAVLSRDAFGGQLRRPFFREVYLRLPVRESLRRFPASPLVLDETVRVRSAIQQALRRPVGEIYEPLVVIQEDGRKELLEMHVLLLEQCQALAETSRELETERDHARSAARSKGEFLANMSHEIRTPMTAILGFTELLLEPELALEERDAHLRTILGNGTHLLTVLDDILDLSKIDAGHLEIREAPCGLRTVLDDTARLFRPRAAGKKLALECEFGQTLPEWVMLDAQRVRQILFNLLSNAIKFTEEGSITLGCHATGGSYGMQLSFTVKDTGIGMSTDGIAHLFQPFQQIDGSSTRRYGGTGLGLVISRRLAELMDGELTVVSEIDCGTRFELRIPMRRAEPHLAESPAAPLPTQVRSNPLEPRGRILLAEDGRDNQLLVRTQLTRAGYEVEIVENGEAAVECLTGAEPKRFDLLLLDMQMPVLDGYGAASELRRRGWSGPIIAFTAHTLTGDRERCLEAGCDSYVSKPIDRARLLEVCAEWIGRTVPASKSPASLLRDGQDCR